MASGYNFNDSPMEVRKWTHVQFGLLSPDEIKAQSVCEVTNSLAYANGLPVDGGLMDLRMGTADRGFRCSTCGMAMDEVSVLSCCTAMNVHVIWLLTLTAVDC